MCVGVCVCLCVCSTFPLYRVWYSLAVKVFNYDVHHVPYTLILGSQGDMNALQEVMAAELESTTG